MLRALPVQAAQAIRVDNIKSAVEHFFERRVSLGCLMATFFVLLSG